MKIVRGFTLIELLVVMGIIAILAVISAPNFLEMQNKVKFREDAQKFLDILGEARSNALANKKCIDSSGSKHDSIKWSVYFREGGTNFKIYCQWDDGTPTYKAAEQDNETNFTLASITKIYLIEDETQAGYSSSYAFSSRDQGFVLVSYLSGTSQTIIESFGENGKPSIASPVLDDLNGHRQKDIRVIFVWEKESGNKKTIVCMNSVAGFPRIEYGGDNSMQNCPDQ